MSRVSASGCSTPPIKNVDDISKQEIFKSPPPSYHKMWRNTISPNFEDLRSPCSFKCTTGTPSFLSPEIPANYKSCRSNMDANYASPRIVRRIADISTGLQGASLSTSRTFCQLASPSDMTLKNISQTLIPKTSKLPLARATHKMDTSSTTCTELVQDKESCKEAIVILTDDSDIDIIDEPVFCRVLKPNTCNVEGTSSVCSLVRKSIDMESDPQGVSSAARVIETIQESNSCAVSSNMYENERCISKAPIQEAVVGTSIVEKSPMKLEPPHMDTEQETSAKESQIELPISVNKEGPYSANCHKQVVSSLSVFENSSGGMPVFCMPRTPLPSPLLTSPLLVPAPLLLSCVPIFHCDSNHSHSSFKGTTESPRSRSVADAHHFSQFSSFAFPELNDRSPVYPGLEGIGDHLSDRMLHGFDRKRPSSIDSQLKDSSLTDTRHIATPLVKRYKYENESDYESPTRHSAPFTSMACKHIINQYKADENDTRSTPRSLDTPASTISAHSDNELNMISVDSDEDDGSYFQQKKGVNSKLIFNDHHSSIAGIEPLPPTPETQDCDTSVNTAMDLSCPTSNVGKNYHCKIQGRKCSIDSGFEEAQGAGIPFAHTTDQGRLDFGLLPLTYPEKLSGLNALMKASDSAHSVSNLHMNSTISSLLNQTSPTAEYAGGSQNISTCSVSKESRKSPPQITTHPQSPALLHRPVPLPIYPSMDKLFHGNQLSAHLQPLHYAAPNNAAVVTTSQVRYLNLNQIHASSWNTAFQPSETLAKSKFVPILPLCPPALNGRGVLLPKPRTDFDKCSGSVLNGRSSYGQGKYIGPVPGGETKKCLSTNKTKLVYKSKIPKPRHAQIKQLHIGSFKFTANANMMAKLKLIFSTKVLSYEVQMEPLKPVNGPARQAGDTVPFAIIDVPFNSIVALNMTSYKITVEVSSPPPMFTGGRVIGEHHHFIPHRIATYNRQKSVDMTGGQIKICPYHEINLERTLSHALIEALVAFDPRFRKMLQQTIVVDTSKELPPVPLPKQKRQKYISEMGQGVADSTIENVPLSTSPSTTDSSLTSAFTSVAASLPSSTEQTDKTPKKIIGQQNPADSNVCNATPPANRPGQFSFDQALPGSHQQFSPLSNSSGIGNLSETCISNSAISSMSAPFCNHTVSSTTELVTVPGESLSITPDPLSFSDLLDSSHALLMDSPQRKAALEVCMKEIEARGYSIPEEFHQAREEITTHVAASPADVHLQLLHEQQRLAHDTRKNNLPDQIPHPDVCTYGSCPFPSSVPNTWFDFNYQTLDYPHLKGLDSYPNHMDNTLSGQFSPSMHRSSAMFNNSSDSIYSPPKAGTYPYNMQHSLPVHPLGDSNAGHLIPPPLFWPPNANTSMPNRYATAASNFFSFSPQEPHHPNSVFHDSIDYSNAAASLEAGFDPARGFDDYLKLDRTGYGLQGWSNNWHPADINNTLNTPQRIYMGNSFETPPELLDKTERHLSSDFSPQILEGAHYPQTSVLKRKRETGSWDSKPPLLKHLCPSDIRENSSGRLPSSDRSGNNLQHTGIWRPNMLAGTNFQNSRDYEERDFNITAFNPANEWMQNPLPPDGMLEFKPLQASSPIV